MLCAICGQAKADDKLKVFSYGAYTQILSILKMNTGYSEKIMASQKDSPVHVCIGCLQDNYQHSTI